jgi:cobalt/nickel transport system permease protein
MQKAAGAARQMMALEELSGGNTAVHRLHPLAKILVTFLYVIAVVSVHRLDYVTLSAFFFYPAILMAVAEIPFGIIAKRTLVALPFVLLAGISNVFFETAPYTAVFGLVISRGIVSAVVLAEKALLTVSAVLILAATTKTAQAFACLRKLGLPKIFITVLMLCLRYLSLLLNEADRMTRAYHLRAKAPKGIRMQDMGSFLGQLLLRSFDRAERVYQAMKLRGFDGSFPAPEDGKMSAASVSYTLAVSGLILFFRFLPLPKLMERLF